MKIISLSSNTSGYACAIATSIKKYFYNNINIKTNIFDYLEISLKSINQILNYTDIELKFKNNHEIYLNKVNTYSVIFKNFHNIISHHDLHLEYNDQEFNNFTDKYIRRYYRLINDLKYEDYIFFIRYGIDDPIEVKYFIESIKNVYPNLLFYYINVDYNENGNDINKDIININYYYINFYNYIDNNIKYDNDSFFKTIQFDWKIIYDLIYDKLDDKYRENFIFYK